MTTSFPGALDGFTNPVGSDSESTIPHHIQHTHANDAIAALEQKVGVNNSSVTSTLDYLVKTAANPGHSHTGSVSFNNIQVTGSTAQAGAGIWSDGVSLFLTTASSLGAVYVRPNGPSNHSYQMVVASSGQIASTDAAGAVRNSLDLGNGNASIVGNLHITGSLSVTGAANVSIPFPTGSENPTTTTTLTLNPTTGSNDGVLFESARSDHSHHINAFNDVVIPSPVSGSPAVGISTYAARADHVHLGGTPVVATLIPTNQTVMGSGAQPPTQINNMMFYANTGGITEVNNAMVVPLAGLYSISYQVQFQNSNHGVVGLGGNFYGQFEGLVFRKASGPAGTWNRLVSTRTTITDFSQTLMTAVDGGYPSCSGTIIAPLEANDNLGLFAYHKNNTGADEATTYYDPTTGTGMPAMPGYTTWISVQLIQ